MLRNSHGRRELRKLFVDLLLAAIAIVSFSLLINAGVIAALGQWLANAMRF